MAKMLSQMDYATLKRRVETGHHAPVAEDDLIRPEDLKALFAEIERLREQLSHEWPAIEELTKEREMYRMRWLGSMTTEDAALIRAENERLRALLNDRSYIRAKADYNRGHLSHANYLESRERGLTLNDEQSKESKS